MICVWIARVADRSPSTCSFYFFKEESIHGKKKENDGR